MYNLTWLPAGHVFRLETFPPILSICDGCRYSLYVVEVSVLWLCCSVYFTMCAFYCVESGKGWGYAVDPILMILRLSFSGMSHSCVVTIHSRQFFQHPCTYISLVAGFVSFYSLQNSWISLMALRIVETKYFGVVLLAVRQSCVIY